VYWVSELDATVWLLVLRQVGHLVDLPAIKPGISAKCPALRCCCSGASALYLAGCRSGRVVYPTLSAPLLPVPSLSYISLAYVSHLSRWGSSQLSSAAIHSMTLRPIQGSLPLAAIVW